MEIVIISLFSLAIILLIISLFKKDKIAKLEEELEQVTLTHMQDIYQLKKKVNILEEELLIQDEPIHYSPTSSQSFTSSTQPMPINEILKSQVLALYRQGRTLDQIEKQSTLTKEQIMDVITEQRLRGFEHE
jgi:hypothetical protein